MSPDTPQPRRSSLAVVALVVALIPGCPVISMTGSLLGLVAARRIARRGLGGMRIARAAVLCGWVATVAWSVAWWWLGSAMRESMEQSVVARVTTVLTPDADVTPAWHGAKPPTDSLRAFRTTALERYGALERVSIISFDSTGRFTDTTQIADLLLFFERDKSTGSAIVTSGFQPQLVRLVVRDRELGDLELGR